MPGAVLGKDKLILDTTALNDSDNVGAFLRDAAGNLITSTLVSGKQAIDANIVNDVVTHDDADHAEDTAFSAGDVGSFSLAVRHDADTTIATTDGNYAPLQVNNKGRLKVDADITMTANFEETEDTAHTLGAIGAFTLAIRQDTLASNLSADGNYGGFKQNNRGALWVAPVGTAADGAADSENPIKVGTRAEAGPLTAVTTGQRADMVSDLYRRLYVNTSANVAISAAAASVTDTAAIVASAVAGRRTIMVSNRGNKQIYLGASSVAAASGFILSAGATISIDLGPNVDLYAVADTGNTVACRVLQLA